MTVRLGSLTLPWFHAAATWFLHSRMGEQQTFYQLLHLLLHGFLEKLTIGSTIMLSCKRFILLHLFDCLSSLRSWVDRDMFMRYLGGGIGHVGQESRWAAHDDGDNMDIDDDDEIEVDPIEASTESTANSKQDNSDDSESESDSDSNDSSADDSDSSGDDSDMDPDSDDGDDSNEEDEDEDGYGSL